MRKIALVLCLNFVALNARAGTYVGPPPPRSDAGAATSPHARHAAPSLPCPGEDWFSALRRVWEGSGEGVTSLVTWSLLLHPFTNSEACRSS